MAVNDFINEMTAEPLTLPYFNIDEFISTGTMSQRFYAAMGGSTNQLGDNADALYPGKPPQIILAQYQAGKYITARLDEMGCTAVEAARKSGINKTMISKYMQQKRPFSPSVGSLVPFCYNVMHESAHKVMFGIEGCIKLPSMYSECAKALLHCSSEKREVLVRKAKLQLTLYNKQNPIEIENAPHIDPSDLVKSRIYELIYDKGIQGYQLLGPDTPYPARAFLRQFFNEQFHRESPRLNYLMFVALETGLALDYFIAENFTKYVPCYYKERDEWKQVTDNGILQFLGICSSLPDENRHELMGEALGIYLSQSFYQDAKSGD